MVDPAKRQQRLLALNRVFNSGAPIQRKDIFRGRWRQIQALFKVLEQPGQHAAIYGERGVGKTSLANIIGDLFLPKAGAAIRTIGPTNCNTDDDYNTLWQKVLRKMGVDEQAHDVTPDLVSRTLSQQDYWPIVIIDELDRFDNQKGLSLLSDTIKDLSDHAAPVTILLVGVGESIDKLVGEHRSITRSLVEVPMPRMDVRELSQIVDNLVAVPLQIDDDARDKITHLSVGLPHYTHLFCLTAGELAIEDDMERITLYHVRRAIKEAVARCDHTVQADYEKATSSPRGKHLYEEVLLACALAKKSNLGWFTQRAVKTPLEKLLKRDEIPFSAFSRHLNAFTDEKRGCVLQREGQTRHLRYRFAEAPLQAYVVLRSMEEGKLPEELFDEMQPRDSLFPDLLDEKP